MVGFIDITWSLVHCYVDVQDIIMCLVWAHTCAAVSSSQRLDLGHQWEILLSNGIKREILIILIWILQKLKKLAAYLVINRNEVRNNYINVNITKMKKTSNYIHVNITKIKIPSTKIKIPSSLFGIWCLRDLWQFCEIW